MDEKPRVESDLFHNPLVPVAELDTEERVACLRLIRSENIGPATFRKLINTFGGAQAALEAIPDLARRGGRRRPVRICPKPTAERELAAAYALNARSIFTIEPGYPKALAAIDYPPPLIYAKGDVGLLSRPSIAVVGSRNCSGAGAALARQWTTTLSQNEFVIVSGLARGIDSVVHKASLASGTIAVLAGGLDTIYPPEHAQLQQDIAEQGCLVSECPPGFKPRGKDFPRRNRIISGLSLAVIVVEAARRSGSLTTARFAAEQGRDVFAVPGHPLDPRAAGTNSLIKSGAILTTRAEDVIAEIAPQLERNDSQLGLNDTNGAILEPAAHAPLEVGSRERERIVSLLGPAPVSIDEICRQSGLHAAQVQTVLLELSLAGRIEHHGQNLVSLSITP